MAEMTQELKVQPLQSKEIKRVLLDRDMSIAALARLATREMGRLQGNEVTAWQMRAVIHRFPGVVYQDIRVWLAGWLGCEVSQVGNEPSRKPKAPENADISPAESAEPKPAAA